MAGQRDAFSVPHSVILESVQLSECGGCLLVFPCQPSVMCTLEQPSETTAGHSTFLFTLAWQQV